MGEDDLRKLLLRGNKIEVVRCYRRRECRRKEKVDQTVVVAVVVVDAPIVVVAVRERRKGCVRVHESNRFLEGYTLVHLDNPVDKSLRPKPNHP